MAVRDLASANEKLIKTFLVITLNNLSSFLVAVVGGAIILRYIYILTGNCTRCEDDAS